MNMDVRNFEVVRRHNLETSRDWGSDFEGLTRFMFPTEKSAVDMIYISVESLHLGCRGQPQRIV